MTRQSVTTTRRAVMAGLAAVPVAGLPATAGEADPIFTAFAEFERATAAEDLVRKASDDLREVTAAALDAAGLSSRQIVTRRRLEDWRELGLCSAADYEAFLAELDGPCSEYEKMLDAVDESEDAARDAAGETGATEAALFETAPTTRAGALRLLRHLAAFLDEDDVVNDLYVSDLVGDAIRNAIAVFEREALS